MTETAVTVVRCRKCRRSADITLIDERLWCARCQGWAEVETERMESIGVDRSNTAPRLARIPPAVPARQALRVAPGWLVSYNELYEADPSSEWSFQHDLLQATNEGRERLLDLDWQADEEFSDGAFRLRLYAGDHHQGRLVQGELLHSFEDRERLAVVAEVERVFHAVQSGRL